MTFNYTQGDDDSSPMKLENIKDKNDLAKLCGPRHYHPMLSVDWCTGEMTIWERHECQRNTWSFKEHHGHESTWVLPIVDALLLKEKLEECQEDINAASAQYRSEWDGSNHVARWNDEGEAQEEARMSIDMAIDSASHLTDAVGYWDPNDWWIGGLGVAGTCEEYGITHKTTDEEIQTITDKMDKEAKEEGVLIDRDDIESMVTHLRDELKDLEEGDEQQEEATDQWDALQG